MVLTFYEVDKLQQIYSSRKNVEDIVRTDKGVKYYTGLDSMYVTDFSSNKCDHAEVVEFKSIL